MPSPRCCWAMRLDKLLVERGFCPTRTQAQAAIVEGRVLVDGVPAAKAGAEISPDAAITVEPGHAYASRGGVKLSHAIETFSIRVAEKIVLDVGASTGGFTDCLLQLGASTVYAVDVGHGQLAASLRSDPRVVSLEGTDIRHMPPLPVRFSLVTVDVSFISLRLVLPALPALLQESADLLCLVKPQFEAGRGAVGKGGIVRDPAVRQAALDGVKDCSVACGFTIRGEIDSPIPGGDGNAEYLLWLTR